MTAPELRLLDQIAAMDYAVAAFSDGPANDGTVRAALEAVRADLFVRLTHLVDPQPVVSENARLRAALTGLANIAHHDADFISDVLDAKHRLRRIASDARRLLPPPQP